jgi:DNA-binding NtrC family response regulator
MENQRILVVDDEEGIRYTLAAFLAAEGYAVTAAGDYAEACARLDAAPFDLIVADILLGAKTGLDILRELRRRDLNIPLVLITGAPQLETATEALRLGASDYIAKPVTREVVLRVVRSVLTCHAANTERERFRRHLEAVFAGVQDGIVTVDAQMRLVACNSAAVGLCGIAPDSVGQVMEEASGGCEGGCLKLLREVVATGQTHAVDRYRCLRDSGAPRVVSLRATPLRQDTGSATGAVLVVRDETHLDSLEQTLKERSHFCRLIGRSQRMQEIYSLIEVLAGVDTTVLVTGESGTGKELVAEALHYSGPRSGKPLVKVNCAALSENLLESELFGHVRGAFTGATADTVGRFQKAHGGTIFLDEIGDISPALQVRLLRVLQEKEIERVGDSTPLKVDVRIIAATHQDLLHKVRRGTFREDLYFRLKVVNVDIPPLRRRKEDLPALIEHFREIFNARFERSVQGFAEKVLLAFVRYDWPGNVRELEHAIEHAFILCKGATITLDHLPPELRQQFGEVRHPRRQEFDAAEAIRAAIERAGGNKAKAARLLGMSRQTLYRKLVELGLDAED